MAASDPENQSLTFALTAPTSALTSNDVPIVWTGSGTGTLVGHVGSATGPAAVTIAIQSNGDYTVTMTRPLDHPINSVEDTINFNVGVNVSDGIATTPPTITVTVEDDMPVACALAQQVTVQPVNTNLMLVLDVSVSMLGVDGVNGQTRLQSAKDALNQLIDDYAALGDVKVRLVIFATNGLEVGSEWVDVATAPSKGGAFGFGWTGLSWYWAAIGVFTPPKTRTVCGSNR